MRLTVDLDDVLAMEVSDDGIGMSEDQVRNVFEAFSQAADQTQYGGTGLGLTIVRTLLR